MQAHITSVWTLGPFRVYPTRRHLFQGSRQIDLSYRSFEILLCLMEAGGRAVAKEELFERLWPGQSVDESNLTKAVAQLRKALDVEGEESAIETIPRIGYRLALPAAEAPLEMPPPSRPELMPGRRARWSLWAAAAGIALLSAGGYYAWDRNWRTQETRRLSREASNYLTSWDNRNYPAAANAYRRIIDLGIEPHAGYWGLAHVAMRQGGQREYALEMLRKSIAIKPDSCGANGLLGYFLVTDFLKIREGERHLNEALRLCPEDSGIKTWWTTMKAARGGVKEALDTQIAARNHNPSSSSVNTMVVTLLFLNGRYEDAIKTSYDFERAASNPQGIFEWRARAYLAVGKKAEAVKAYARGPFAENAPEVLKAIEKSGDAGLQALLNATSENPLRLRHSYRRAVWMLSLGRHQEALSELEYGFGPRAVFYWMNVDPVWDPIRTNPRFQALAAKLEN